MSDGELTRRYLANPNECPYCKSTDISETDADPDGEITMQASCDSCGAEWIAGYRLAWAVHHKLEEDGRQ